MEGAGFDNSRLSLSGVGLSGADFAPRTQSLELRNQPALVTIDEFGEG
jgi:hypothetical protein